MHRVSTGEAGEFRGTTRATLQSGHHGFHRGGRILRHAVNFDAIAGGKENNFLEPGALAQTAHHGVALIIAHREAFAQRNRGGVMTQAEREEIHARARRVTAVGAARKTPAFGWSGRRDRAI